MMTRRCGSAAIRCRSGCWTPGATSPTRRSCARCSSPGSARPRPAMRLGPEPVRSFLWRRRRDVRRLGRPLMRSGSLDAIFVTGAGGAPMESVESVESVGAVAGGGLRGDRYSEHRGHWSPLDECQVTLIAAETLDEIETTFGVAVHAGEHRRNLVTRGLDLMNLYGRTFTIGDAELALERPRPPRRYIE